MGHGMARQLSTITKSQQPRHRSALIPLNKAIAIDDTANQQLRSFSSAPHTLLIINKNQNPNNESQPSIARMKSTSTIVLLSLPKFQFQFQSPGINPLLLPLNSIANSKKEECGCKKHRRKCQFLDPLKHNWINLGIQPSCYLVKLIRSRLTQSNNHIKYSNRNKNNIKI